MKRRDFLRGAMGAAAAAALAPLARFEPSVTPRPVPDTKLPPVPRDISIHADGPIYAVASGEGYDGYEYVDITTFGDITEKQAFLRRRGSR